MKVLIMLSVGLPGLSSELPAQASSPSGAVAAVAKLYRDFAGGAVIHDRQLSGDNLINQPRSVLTRYVNDSLATLILKDRACVAREGAICNLDFDPVCDSQDPVGTTVRILATSDTSVVLVKLRYFERPKIRQLTYRMVETPADWRVHDIEYDSGMSLVEILQRP
jgi:hypothetical protein